MNSVSVINQPQVRTFAVRFRSVTIATSGSPADRANAEIPASVTRWRPISVTFRAASATGTMAAATVGLFTQAGGTGTTIVAAALTASLTAVNKLQAMTVAAVTDGITDTNIFVRQTVNSVNAGTLDVIVTCEDLT